MIEESMYLYNCYEFIISKNILSKIVKCDIFSCMENIFKKINDLKFNNDSFGLLFLKLIYKVFSNQIINSILNVAIPFLFSLPIIKDTSLFLKFGLIGLGVLVSVNVISLFCTEYKIYSSRKSVGYKVIIDNVNSLYKIYNERITDHGFDGLFELISDYVCQDLYHFFKNTLNVETRVSLIQQYPKANDFFSVMISRTSKNTQKLGRKKNNSKVQFEHNRHKYYNQLLLDNNDRQVVLLERKVEDYFSFKSNKQN